jgi:aryl-alcohol dehydrogenase-like predicted oxidoreductase
MPMSIEGRPDAERSIATIHAALDAGITLIDTADAYHLLPGEVGHNEELNRTGVDGGSDPTEGCRPCQL